MALTILVTGFGPFPGAPFNPTGPLVKRLARLRRPGVGRRENRPAYFPDQLCGGGPRPAQADRAQHRPDALLMFGLATRARRCASRRARAMRWRCCPTPAARPAPRRHCGRPNGGIAMPAPVRRLLAAVRAAACRPCCRAMPGATCAITCAGARPRRRAKTAARASPPSCMCREHRAAGRAGPANAALTLDDLRRAGAADAGRGCRACHV